MCMDPFSFVFEIWNQVKEAKCIDKRSHSIHMRINECITYIRHDQTKKFVLVDSVLPFKHYICVEDMKETAQIQKYYK